MLVPLVCFQGGLGRVLALSCRDSLCVNHRSSSGWLCEAGRDSAMKCRRACLENTRKD